MLYTSGSCRVVRVNQTSASAAVIAMGKAVVSTASAFHSSIAPPNSGQMRSSQRNRSPCCTAERLNSSRTASSVT